MLSTLNQAQRQRLAYIDFCLQYYGQIGRADLIKRFKTGVAAATRDFSSYRQLAPDNLELVHQTKNYHRKNGFKPLFDHDPEAVLTGLCRGFGDGFSFGIDPSEVCVDAIRLIHPDTEIIASLMRAIKNRFALSCRYVSLSSGETTREIVPHAIVNNGHRWHVRAFDRKNDQFRDFVCSRFCQMSVVIDPAKLEEKREQDNQWNRIVELTLVPHPSLKIPRAIEMDYQMSGGKLNLEVRAAIAGYLLAQWHVDCTNDASLTHHQYQLALANPAALYGVNNLLLAPGYKALC